MPLSESRKAEVRLKNERLIMKKQVPLTQYYHYYKIMANPSLEGQTGRTI